jgi:hypothetical protein
MNPPAPQRNFAIILGLLALSGLGLFLLKESLQNRAALTGLRLEADEMRGRLEAKDETVGVLQRELHRLQREVAEQEGKQAEDPRFDSLLVIVGTLSGQQSNLFARIDGIGIEAPQSRSGSP